MLSYHTGTRHSTCAHMLFSLHAGVGKATDCAPSMPHSHPLGREENVVSARSADLLAGPHSQSDALSWLAQIQGLTHR